MPRTDLIALKSTHTEIGLLLALLDDATNEWTKHLGNVPPPCVRFQAVPNGHSIGVVLLHIADVEAYWLHEIAAGQPRSQAQKQRFLSDETHQGRGQWPASPAEPLSYFLEQLREVRVRTHELILEINNPDHEGRRGDETFTLRWLLGHVISHDAYHGGQAVLLAHLWNKQNA